MNIRSWVVGASVFAACVGLAVSQSDAQIKAGKSRPLKTKHLMSAVVVTNCGALRKALDGAGPADDKAWEAAEINAALLNEAGHSLMADGRCPDATWAAASKALQDGGAAAVAKVQAKDVAGAKEALGVVLGSCKSCHTAHKK